MLGQRKYIKQIVILYIFFEKIVLVKPAQIQKLSDFLFKKSSSQSSITNEWSWLRLCLKQKKYIKDREADIIGQGKFTLFSKKNKSH